MSFRFTNNLVGALKHRLLLESAHRRIARETYKGVCNGVEVTCSGYGTVLAIQLLDKPTWERFYRSTPPPPSQVDATRTPTDLGEGEGGEAAAAAPTNATSALDLGKLSTSIKAALWSAQQKLNAAKEEAHQHALRRNSALLAAGELRHWYEQDATTLHPRRSHSLKQEMATPYMQAVRLGKSHTEALAAAQQAATRKQRHQQPSTRMVTAEEDCAPAAIPIGSTHPLWAAGLIRLEDGSNTHSHSRVNENVVLVEQKQEMAKEEEKFWDRVELIRRGQLATIPGGVKRPYADGDNATVKEEVEEKIVLRFTQ